MARTQKAPDVSVVSRRPSDGVELVVAHHRQGGASLDHVANQRQGAELGRAAVDEVTHKNRMPLMVTPSVWSMMVPENSKKLL